MDKKEFALRLSTLRTNKGVSARDMSLSIGQNPSYINHIECEKSLPSMDSFFFICEYLGISPMQFFDIGSKNPSELDSLISNLKKLDSEQLSAISQIVKNMIR